MLMFLFRIHIHLIQCLLKRFYEEFASSNKNKTTETDTGKAKTEEKVTEINDNF